MADSAGDLIPAIEKQIQHNRENGWLDLEADERGVALKFVECSYSIGKVAEEMEIPNNRVRALLRRPLVLAYVAHLQEEDRSSSIITKQFISASLLNLIPKLAGEEEVPLIDNYGEQIYRKKFFPGELRAVLQTLSESTDFKKETDAKKGGVNVQINFGNMMSPGSEPEVIINEPSGDSDDH